MATSTTPISIPTWLETASRVRQMVKSAQAQLHHRRKDGLAAFDALFQQGSLPQTLKGNFDGAFVAFNLGPALSPLLEGLTWAWPAWRGKRFQAGEAAGDNLLDESFLPLARLLWPFYRGFCKNDALHTWHGMAFRTWKGPALADAGQRVLKIDYDLPANPTFTVRRVLDELVELEPGFYLGKWNFRWWWGRWQTIAYFTLTASE